MPQYPEVLTATYIKQQKEDEKDALKERKDAFDELIEKEKEELAAKKESAKFDEELAKKQNTVAKNALAASVASLDDSSAGRKAQKKANDALAESRSDLASTLADHEYDIRVKALDELKAKNDEYYDAETKKIDDYLSNARQLYEDACAMIENDTGDLYGKLWDYTYKHTTQTRAEFDYMWSSAQTALSKYDVAQRGVIGVLEFLQGTIYNTEIQIKNLDTEINNISTTICKLSHITFLQKRISLLENGRIVVKISRQSITRQRRKLKKLTAKWKAGEIEYRHLISSYKSWKGTALKFDAYETVQSMDELFYELVLEGDEQ